MIETIDLGSLLVSVSLEKVNRVKVRSTSDGSHFSGKKGGQQPPAKRVVLAYLL